MSQSSHHTFLSTCYDHRGKCRQARFWSVRQTGFRTDFCLLSFCLFCFLGAACKLLSPTVSSDQKLVPDEPIYHSPLHMRSPLVAVFFHPCRLCLSRRCFHLPCIFPQTCIPHMSDISDPLTIPLCHSEAHMAWCDWEQSDLSENLEVRRVWEHVQTYFAFTTMGIPIITS